MSSRNRRRNKFILPQLTKSELKAAVNQIVQNHYVNNRSLFAAESFKMNTDRGTFVVSSSVAKATLTNPTIDNTRIIFDSTENNEVKQNNPAHYEKVSNVFKAILIDIANLYRYQGEKSVGKR